MRPVSDQFLRIVRGSAPVRTRVRVVHPAWSGIDPVGDEIPVLGGNIKFDASADVRGTVDLTTSGDLWPTQQLDLLAPYGNDLFIECGVVLGNGDREWVSQGYFSIYDITQDDAPDGPIRIAARDRNAKLIDGRLESPIEFEAGSSIDLIFSVLVGEIHPNATIIYDFNAAGTLLTSTHVAEQDRFDFLQDVARAYGKVMYWDYAGELRVESPPDPRNPVFDVNSGAGGVLVSAARNLSRDGVYNSVVASGEKPGNAPPVRGIARDMNPDSPTYWDGIFGHVPRFYGSDFINNEEQARGAAETLLRQNLGLPYNVDFTAAPNPALEVLDPVLISFGDRNEMHVIETLMVPLTESEPLTATTREQTTVLIGLD